MARHAGRWPARGWGLTRRRQTGGVPVLSHGRLRVLAFRAPAGPAHRPPSLDRSAAAIAGSRPAGQRRPSMPYVNLQITRGATRAQEEAIVREFTEVLARVLS